VIFGKHPPYVFLSKRGGGIYFLASAFGWQQLFMAIKNHSEEWLLEFKHTFTKSGYLEQYVVAPTLLQISGGVYEPLAALEPVALLELVAVCSLSGPVVPYLSAFPPTLVEVLFPELSKSI